MAWNLLLRRKAFILCVNTVHKMFSKLAIQIQAGQRHDCQSSLPKTEKLVLVPYSVKVIQERPSLNLCRMECELCAWHGRNASFGWPTPISGRRSPARIPASYYQSSARILPTWRFPLTHMWIPLYRNRRFLSMITFKISKVKNVASRSLQKSV